MPGHFQVRNKLCICIDPDIQEISYDQEKNIISIPSNYHGDDVSFLVRNYPYSKLKILSSSLITKEVIDALKDNLHLSFIQLGSKEDPYVLTREVFDILNTNESLLSIDTQGVEGEYSTREMETILFFKRMVVQKYSIENLLTNQEFTFYAKLEDQELDYLKKYVANGVTMHFYYDDYADITKVIQSLSGKQIHFCLQQYDDLSFYLKDFQQLLVRHENISFMQIIDLEQYIKMDFLLELMIKDLKESGLSSYEKYLGVYEIVTHFKTYLENEENRREARELEYILFNNFYVCYGISELMVTLLDKVGIRSYNIQVEYYKDKKKLTPLEQEYLDKQLLYVGLGNQDYYTSLLAKGSHVAKHSRLLVRLTDPKYDIDGLFLADPTWDNNLEHHYFTHSLMTSFETSLENIHFYDSDISLLSVSSSEEFFLKLKQIPDAITNILNMLEKVDPPFYQSLKEQYDLNPNNLHLLLDLYNYIIHYAKNHVSREKQEQALYTLFRFIYASLEEERFQQLFTQMLEENQKRNLDFFRGRS